MTMQHRSGPNLLCILRTGPRSVLGVMVYVNVYVSAGVCMSTGVDTPAGTCAVVCMLMYTVYLL